jgi:hypothetical protein
VAVVYLTHQLPSRSLRSCEVSMSRPSLLCYLTLCAGIASDNTCVLTVYSFRPCESIGVILARERYVSWCITFLRLTWAVPTSATAAASCLVLWVYSAQYSHVTTFFFTWPFCDKEGLCYLQWTLKHSQHHSKWTWVRSYELVLGTALCYFGVCVCVCFCIYFSSCFVYNIIAWMY